MTSFQNSVIRLLITILLLTQTNAQQIKNLKRTANRNLELFNQITLKFLQTGTFIILNYENIDIFETNNFHLYDLDSKKQIVETSSCTKSSDTHKVSCTITTTSIQIEISKEVVNLKGLFSESEASEIIFEESWKNTKISNIEKMCSDAKNLENIDISNLNTDDLISMDSLFYGS